MKSYFSADFFTQNRQRLLKMLPADTLVIITANGVLQRSSDTTFPFSQDRNFWYVTGIHEPDVLLVIDSKQEYLILPPQNDVRDIFDGAIDIKKLRTTSGINDVRSFKQGWDEIRTALERKPHVCTIVPGPSYEPNHAMYVNPARRRLVQQIRHHAKGVKLRDLRAEFASLRVRKQPEELNALQAAVDITCDTFAALRSPNVLSTFQHEYELEAAITHEFRRKGAAGHAYSPIVASGKHATTLHYVTNEGELKPGELAVVDVGAEVEGYAADMTRTLSKKALTARQASVITAVTAVQDFALALLKPGTLLRDYERQVMLRMGKELKALGLITDSHDEAAIRYYYPHATSHFLGLDVHDVGTYNQPLEAGMVLTCEPGIYIPEESIGVRIEDNILITDGGHQNLSMRCAREAYVL